jgi:glycosyltransferase involved in cell wall biosynthesis
MIDGIDVVISARNEAATILDVVDTLIDHPAIKRVIVGVDKDTTDETYNLLLTRDVTCMFNGRGKGQVARKGLVMVNTPYVLFCDADITGLTQNHIGLLLAEAIYDDEGKHPTVTIGVPDIPDNYPTDRLWAWPWVSGQRCVPTRLVRPLHLHGYLMETQINAATRHAGMPVHFEWLKGLKSSYNMSPQRIEEMQRDADYGRRHHIL